METTTEPTVRAHFTVTLPDLVRSLLETVAEVGAVVGLHRDREHLVIEINAESEFELGRTIAELEGSLAALWTESFVIERIEPEAVEVAR